MDKKLVALHKHWCNADAIKQFICTPILKGSKEAEKIRLPKSIVQLGEMHSSFIRLQVWYALLYVVIEGYIELKQSNTDVDSLLTNKEMVAALLRFRNAVFHYQKDPINEKLLKFLEAKDSELWIKQLNDAFEAYFESIFHIKKSIEYLAEPAAS